MTLITLLTISMFYCKGQINCEINYSDSSTLTINKIKLQEKMNDQDFLKIFGKPTRVVEYRNTEKGYYYDNDGFVVFSKNSFVTMIGVNFNWDGDKKFPEKAFTGSLKIGELTINKETKKGDIDTLKAIGYDCPMDILCGSKSRNAKIKSIIGFKSTLLSQVAFMLN